MPLATTSSALSPVSVSVGTSNQVETMAEPVATGDDEIAGLADYAMDD